MKRLGSLILAACMVLTMAGCRSRIDPDTEKVIREAVEDDLVHEVLPVYALLPETTIKRIKMQHDTDFTVTGTYELNDELFQTIYTGKFELTGYIDDGEVEIVSRAPIPKQIPITAFDGQVNSILILGLLREDS